MKRISVVVVMCALAAQAVSVAAATADFEKVKKGSRVRIVLADGGECRGQVAKRGAGSLNVKLAEDSTACGARAAIVTVRQSNISGVEKTEASVGRKIAARLAGAATGFVMIVAGGGVIASGHPYVGLGLAVGGVPAGVTATELLVKKGSGYTLFVARLGDGTNAPARDPD